MQTVYIFQLKANGVDQEFYHLNVWKTHVLFHIFLIFNVQFPYKVWTNLLPAAKVVTKIEFYYPQCNYGNHPQ